MVPFLWILLIFRLIFQWKKLGDEEKAIYEARAKKQNEENQAKHEKEQAEIEER